VTESKLIALLVGIIVFLGAIFFGFRAVYDAGDNAGAARIQKQWDANKADIQRTADAAIAQATKDKETAIANNEGVINDLQTQVNSTRNLAGDLAKRLSDAENRATAYSGALSKTSDQLAATSRTTAQIMGQLNGAVADALNECGEVRADYKALIAEIKPQM
jgi:hypothetical protein